MSNNKVKGLLKGLRYISQIFENEKEQDIQIGYPTDVKHVAHIGWDGPSVNTPSWMNEYKSSQSNGFASAPLNLTGDAQNKGPDNSVNWSSEDSRRSRSRFGQGEGLGRDMPDLPKGSRRQSTGNMTDSPSRDKSRQSKKSSNKPSSLSKDLPQGEGSPAPDIPKKTRRKKSKENSSSGGGGGSKSSSKEAPPQDPNRDFESASQPVSGSRIS